MFSLPLPNCLTAGHKVCVCACTCLLSAKPLSPFDIKFRNFALLLPITFEQDGYLPKHDLLAGCATLGVVLNDQELNTLMPLLKHDEEGKIDYQSFISAVTSATPSD